MRPDGFPLAPSPKACFFCPQNVCAPCADRLNLEEAERPCVNRREEVSCRTGAFFVTGIHYFFHIPILCFHSPFLIWGSHSLSPCAIQGSVGRKRIGPRLVRLSEIPNMTGTTGSQIWRSSGTMTFAQTSQHPNTSPYGYPIFPGT
jgi:hypothetical protein